MNKSDIIKIPDLNVVIRILERIWKENGPISKTRLQIGANVNYDTFVKYLIWMEQHDLVEISITNEGNERIILTNKGMDVCAKLVRALSEIFDSNAPNK
jgi:predicted transcriptional regulator